MLNDPELRITTPTKSLVCWKRSSASKFPTFQLNVDIDLLNFCFLVRFCDLNSKNTKGIKLMALMMHHIRRKKDGPCYHNSSFVWTSLPWQLVQKSSHGRQSKHQGLLFFCFFNQTSKTLPSMCVLHAKKQRTKNEE